MRIAHLFSIVMAILTLSCGPAASQPAFSEEQAIKRATEDARRSVPEVGIQEARIDRVTAELITLGEADRRFGGERGPGGYPPGQNQNTPVWWVKVEGRFRYQGMIRQGTTGYGPHSYDLVEADERDFVYDARTGEPVGSSIPGTRVIGTVVPSAAPTSSVGEQPPRPTDKPAPPGARPTSTPLPTAPVATPSPGSSFTFSLSMPLPGNAEPRSAVRSFMQARWSKQHPETDALMSEELRRSLEANQLQARDLYLYPASNPCWYRYELLPGVERPSADWVAARVRVYEHQWGGDLAGGLPRSWEQQMELARTADGWKVDGLGKPENTREQPGEPHGETVSACNQPRATQPVPTPRPTSTTALTAETDAERVEITRRLFEEYLEGFKATTDLKSRLWEYRIDEVRLYPMPGEVRPRVIVVYSVLPIPTARDRWIAGNGAQDGLWIARKLHFVEVVKEGDGYRISSMGTGP